MKDARGVSLRVSVSFVTHCPVYFLELGNNAPPTPFCLHPLALTPIFIHCVSDFSYSFPVSGCFIKISSS